MRLLFRFFLRSFFVGDGLAPGSDPSTLAITAAAFFAAPGLAVCMVMTVFGSKLNTDPAVAFFLALSMILAGLLALVLWDDLLPTRLDFLILRPQPLPWSRAVLAKLCAWGVLMTAFMATVNLFSCSMLPIVNAADQASGIAVLRRIGAQALGVAAGSAWIFLWMLALRGAAAVFGEGRPVVRAARLALTAALLAAIVLSPELTEPDIYRHLAGAPPLWCAPLFWFLGITHALTGHASAAWAPLAWIGARQLAAALAAAALFYAWSCWQLPRRALATASGRTRGPWPSAFAAGEPRRAAVYRFALATLARSRRHSLLLAAWLGFALAVVLASLASLTWTFPSPTLAQTDAVALAAPLVLCCLIAVGLRHAFAIPIEIRANWLFRVAETEAAPVAAASELPFTATSRSRGGVPPAVPPRWRQAIFGRLHLDRLRRLGEANQREARGEAPQKVAVPQRLLAARDILLALAVMPPLLLGAVLAWRIWGWNIALLHVLFCGSLMLLWIEALLLRFPKIPFTCPYVSGRANLKLWGFAYWLAFSTFAFGSAALERRWWPHPDRIVAASAAALAVAIALRLWNRNWLAALPGCQFEDAPEPVVQQLFFGAGTDLSRS